MRRAAKRGHAENRLLSVGTLPGGGLLYGVDALVVEVLADREADAGRPRIDRVEGTGRPAVLVELQHVQDVGDGEIGLTGCQYFPRLHTAAALNQLEVIAFVAKEALFLSDELHLIGGHGDRIYAESRLGHCLGVDRSRSRGGPSGGGYRGRDDRAAPHHESQVSL